MRHLATLLTALVAAVSVAHGEPAKAGRTCRILVLGADENSPKTIFLNDGTATQPVELPSLNLSDVYKLAPGNTVLRLCNSMPTDQQPVPDGAPSVAVPESISDLYLIITSDPKNTVVPLRCQVVDASPSGFRTGQMMWLNLTPYRVGGQLGSKTLNLKPNSQAIVEAPAQGSGSYPVKIGYAPAEDQKAVLMVSTEWPHNPAARNVVFVMMLPNSKIPRIKGYDDYREPQQTP